MQLPLNHIPNFFYFNPFSTYFAWLEKLWLSLIFCLGKYVMNELHNVIYNKVLNQDMAFTKWLPWQSEKLDFPTLSVTWPRGQGIHLVDISELE